MDEQRRASVPWWPAILIMSLAVGLWSILAFTLYRRLGSELEAIDKYGQFGDSFGVLNSLFSMLAFAVIAASLYLQRRELQATLNEIRASAKAQQALALAAEAERRHRATELGLRFFSEHFRKVRSEAWALRNAIWKDSKSAVPDEDSLTVALARAWIDNDRAAFQAAAAPWQLPEGADRAMSEIVEFYVFLTDYFQGHGDEEINAVLNAYRYPYWRGLLIELRRACEQRYANGLSDAQKKVFPRPYWMSRLEALEAAFARRYPYVRADDPVQ